MLYAFMQRKAVRLLLLSTHSLHVHSCALPCMAEITSPVHTTDTSAPFFSCFVYMFRTISAPQCRFIFSLLLPVPSYQKQKSGYRHHCRLHIPSNIQLLFKSDPTDQANSLSQHLIKCQTLFLLQIVGSQHRSWTELILVVVITAFKSGDNCPAFLSFILWVTYMQRPDKLPQLLLNKQAVG